MARIRSVKPEFWDDEAIGLLSRDARLLYIATWNMADDEGLLRWTAPYVKANAFMYDDDLDVDAVVRLMAELTGAGLIASYIGGKAHQALAWVVQFHKHQKPNRPQPSKLPPPSIQNGEIIQSYVRRDGNVCHLCGQECSTAHDKPRLWPSLDHLTPRSQGGSDYPSNLKLSHVSCNKARRDRPVDECAGSTTVIGSRSDSVNPALPEGSGEEEESEQERKGVVALARTEPPDDPTSELLIEHIKSYAEPPPLDAQRAVKTAIMRQVALGETPERIRAGLARMRHKSVAVSLLPQLIAECSPVARPSTTDARVASGLALVEKYRAQEAT